MIRVFVDTGAFVALRRADESEHARARDALVALVDRRVRLVSTNYTFGETYTTLLASWTERCHRVGQRDARRNRH